MVEHAAVNRGVVGSSPTRGANLKIGRLSSENLFCVSGAYSSAVEPPAHNRLVPGSIPGGPTKSSWPVGQAVKTPPFHGGIGGSIPPRVTKNLKSGKNSRTFIFFVRRGNNRLWRIMLIELRTCTEKLNRPLCEFFFPMLFGKFVRSFVLQAAMWPEVVILPSPSLDFLPGFRHRTEPVFI